jgi:DNA (cytosine-5)-methyltransferase 1
MVTVISLFAGCGGSSLGYKMAGFKELLAIEWENNAVETFRLNFPEVPIWQKDINKVTGQEILDFLNIKKGELDLLDGSPPCQGFSTAGKRKVNDDRNDLVKENIRLIEELEPKVFVIENVSGMIKGKMKGLFIEYMKKMKSLNYQVKCKLMNAKYYNVPQSRQRVIFIGVRKDLGIEPSYPEGNKKIISVKDILKDCSDDIKYYPQKKAKVISCRLKQWQDGSDIIKDKFFNLKKLALNKPSRTITKTIRLSQCGLLHPKEDRYLTINELKRIATFPDDYEFIGKFEEQWARIGNSVPPLFMKAMAEHIRINILEKAVKL